MSDGHGRYFYRCGIHIKVQCKCFDHANDVVIGEACPECKTPLEVPSASAGSIGRTATKTDETELHGGAQ